MDDDRFKHVFTDPIFKPTSKKNKKILIEKRFKSALKDKRFNSFSKYDSRGKPLQPENVNDLIKYYEIKDDIASVVSSESDSSPNEQTCSSEDSAIFDLPTEATTQKVTETTRRLALCGVDWDVVTAKVCMNLFKSFLPEQGNLISVDLYKSDFGLKREEKDNRTGLGAPNSKEAKRRLRRYERERLFYYYAILEFDSPDSANVVYEECDGKEMELTGLTIDLRFVGDEVKFDGPHIDSCSEPVEKLDNYLLSKPSKSSIQSKEVPLWDRNDAKREDLLLKAFDLLESDNNGKEPNFRELIGSRSSDESAGENEIRRERELLLGEDASDSNYKFKYKEPVQMDFSWHFASGEDSESEDSENLIKTRESIGENEQGTTKNHVAEEAVCEDSGEEILSMDEVKVRKNKRSKKRKEEVDENVYKLKDEITSDPRFQSLFSDPKFNIDISSHEFKSSQFYSSLRDDIITYKSKMGDNVDVAPLKESVEKIADKIKMKFSSKKNKLF